MKKHFKLISLLFSILLLLQSCKVYKTANVSLDEASKSDTKVRVESINGEKAQYYRIVILDDGEFYGQKKLKRENVYNYILINEDDIEKVQLLDKKASTITNIFIPALILATIIGVTASAINNMDVL